MHADLNDNFVSDQIERELIRQTSRNRQIPHRHNGGLLFTRTIALATFELVQSHLRNIFSRTTTRAN